MSDIRVRIAPSPTGNLHVGTARTALFNYLFAKHNQGTFILRIEDTDLERSETRFEQDIYDGLRLLGLNWDEGPDVGGPYGPYRQTERLELYTEYAQKLIASGHAYEAWETADELEAEKQAAIDAKQPYAYRRREYTADQIAAFKADPNRQASLRFHIPSSTGTIVLNDAIRGAVSFDSNLIGDFVIMKSNGVPTYNFAVVVDDITMKISHVIRGEDHISNTPRQMLIYQALGATLPVFAHAGMILAPDRSKMSKRHGATAVAEFVRNGYLPEAFCNFLALLGWSPPDGQEIATLQHIAQQFTLDRLAHSPAVFDQDKLNWLNASMIRAMDLPELLKRSRPFINELDLSRYSEDQLCVMLDAVREPISRLSELTESLTYFTPAPITSFEDEAKTTLAEADAAMILTRFQSEMINVASFDSPEALSETLKAFTKSLQPLKTKTVMWTIRSAVTGRVHGADLTKTLWLLGKELVTQRVASALGTLSPVS